MQPHKHAAVIKAWADGAQIQMKLGGVWRDLPDLDGAPSWYPSNEYRVKPKDPVVITTSIFLAGLGIAHCAMGPSNVKFFFDPDSRELLSVEKI